MPAFDLDAIRMILVGIMSGLLGLAIAAPVASRRFGRDAGYLLAAGFAIAAGALWIVARPVLGGAPIAVEVPWIPHVGLGASLLLDGLSLLFALLILVVGGIVAAYAARYFAPARTHGRVYAWLTVFALAMFGLVVADDLVLLVVFWELTSVCSFVLIGGRGQHRAPATRALVTTTAGGLALLAATALIIAGTGQTRLTQVLADPEAILDSAIAPGVIALLIVAAATKSAQVPFHFWLPGAMVAPTPVSTYLHAATMVKAGVYLLLRFTPVFGGVVLWQATLAAVGATTALWGAILALRRHDLKAILAYSTISQLGLLVALTAVATPAAIAAVGVLLVAHGAYKATLFMVVGVIDHQAGTRDLRQLGGLRHRMPLTTGVAAAAALSMAGVPPLVGFVGKEEALGAVLAWPAPGWVRLLAVAAVASVSVLTVAYSARLFAGAFGAGSRGDPTRPQLAFVAPAGMTALAGGALGVGVPLLEPVIDGMVGTVLIPSVAADLALWHGLTIELGLSGGIVAMGAALFLWRHRVQGMLDRTSIPRWADGTAVYDRLHAAVLAFGGQVARSAAARAPTAYVGAALASVVTAGVAVTVVTRPSFPLAQSTTRPLDWVLVALTAGVLVLLVITRDRLTAVVLLGTVGYVLALWFATLGAADLALTLLLVETLFVAAAVLAIRSLRRPLRRQRPRRSVPTAALAVCAGGVAFAATWWLTGRRALSEPGRYFLENSERVAGGRNVVNSILVDFRALDTLGEVIVVVAAIVGLSVIAGWVRRGRST